MENGQVWAVRVLQTYLQQVSYGVLNYIPPIGGWKLLQRGNELAQRLPRQQPVVQVCR